MIRFWGQPRVEIPSWTLAWDLNSIMEGKGAMTITTWFQIFRSEQQNVTFIKVTLRIRPNKYNGKILSHQEYVFLSHSFCQIWMFTKQQSNHNYCVSLLLCQSVIRDANAPWSLLRLKIDLLNFITPLLSFVGSLESVATSCKAERMGRIPFGFLRKMHMHHAVGEPWAPWALRYPSQTIFDILGLGHIWFQSLGSCPQSTVITSVLT